MGALVEEAREKNLVEGRVIRVSGLRFGVWGLGFRVEGLEFGV